MPPEWKWRKPRKQGEVTDCMQQKHPGYRDGLRDMRTKPVPAVLVRFSCTEINLETVVQVLWVSHMQVYPTLQQISQLPAIDTGGWKFFIVGGVHWRTFPSLPNLCPPDVSATSLTVVAILTIAWGCKTTDSPAGKSCFREHFWKQKFHYCIHHWSSSPGNSLRHREHFLWQEPLSPEKNYIQQNKKLNFFFF